MRKQHTIINANDIHAALAGQEVQPMKKNDKPASKKPAARKTKINAAHARAAEICKQLCFCFEVKPEPVYFKDINNMQELKKKYKELASVNHPDKGGDSITMGKINAEYDEKVKELASTAEKPRNGYTKKAAEMTDEEIAAAIAEEFKATLEKLMTLNLDGVKVELIGSWLWVSGNTKPIKEELKSLKFRWAKNKEGQPWTWCDSYTYYD